MLDLIARRPERLNILVTAINHRPGLIGPRGNIATDPATWNAVVLRYSYTAVDLPEGDARPTGRGVPTLTDRTTWRDVPDVDGIRAAVAELQAVWGPIPVQDNSGAVPELDSRARASA